MSAKIRGINAPPGWTYWTIEMAPPVIFVQTEPIGETIVYDGSIIDGGISPEGDTIREIRAFIDVSGYPVAYFHPTGIIKDGKNYLFDFETGILSEGAVKTNFLPFILIGGGLVALCYVGMRRRK